MNHRVGDVDTSAGTDIEGVSVVATLAVTIGVVDSDSIQSKAIGIVDAEDLDGGVLDIDILDLGVDHLVGSEELGLSLAAVGSLAIPPAGTISIEDSARSSLDSNVSSGDGDQGTVPFLVAEGGLSLEDDLKDWLVDGLSEMVGQASHSGSLLQSCQIESSTSGNSDGRQDNGRARSLGLDCGSGTAGAGEGASGSSLLESGCCDHIEFRDSIGNCLDGSSTEQADEGKFEHDEKD